MTNDLWTFVPEQNGLSTLMAIVAAAVEGPYRVVHHALLPYLRIAPATATARITVRSRPELQLVPAGERVRQLIGSDDVLDCAILFTGHGEQLQDLGRRAVALDSVDPLHPFSHRPLPGGPMPPRAVRLGRPVAAPTLEGGAAAPSRPTSQRPVPQSLDVVPTVLQPLIEAEGVHPDLGDYLVLPTHVYPELTTLPDWVVRYPVEQIRIVKPRLKVDRPMSPLPSGESSDRKEPHG